MMRIRILVAEVEKAKAQRCDTDDRSGASKPSLGMSAMPGQFTSRGT